MKSRAERESEENVDEAFSRRAIKYMPQWAWACCAILMASSIAIRQIGLDVTTPLNRIMTAYAVRIEGDVTRSQKISEFKLQEIEERLVALENVAHKSLER
jgi:hypothetical protein